MTKEFSQVDAFPVNDLLATEPDPYLDHQRLLFITLQPPLLSQLEQETVDGIPIPNVNIPKRVIRLGQSGHADRDFLEHRGGH